jgi:hypothetical protein
MEQLPSTHKPRRCKQSGEGLAIGVGIGVALGAAFNNLAVGIALGAGLGVVFDEVIARRNRPRQ